MLMMLLSVCVVVDVLSVLWFVSIVACLKDVVVCFDVFDGCLCVFLLV